jgi:hypothetical protein
VSFVVIFTLGYLVGGVSALVVLSLTLASQRGDQSRHGSVSAE